MGKFLDTYNQPTLNKEDIKHLSSPIICNEIEAVIKNLPAKKSQDLMDSQLNFTKLLNKS
jgi:hypothetical protein